MILFFFFLELTIHLTILKRIHTCNYVINKQIKLVYPLFISVFCLFFFFKFILEALKWNNILSTIIISQARARIDFLNF